MLPKYKLNYRNGGVINYIDVGSAGGLCEPWRSNARRIKYLLNFEPNGDVQKGQDTMTYNTALWEDNVEKVFYVYKSNFKYTGSSLYQQNYDYVKENWNVLKDRGLKSLAETWHDRSSLVREVKLRCRKLDDIVNEECSGRMFHLLKVDAQGAEYNVLKGATSLLSNSLVALHLELFTIPLYRDIALMDEVVSYLKKYGFDLARKYPAQGSFHASHDCLFINRHSVGREVDTVRSVYEI
jgi:FkbM family methyltransferase